jgi:putative sigma-54 modulation protein
MRRSSQLISKERRMNLTISGHHLELTPAIREYVEAKLERIKPADKDKRQKAEINLHLRGTYLHVESIAQDLYAAIDALIDKLDRQVIKYKSKIQNHQHDGIKRISEVQADADTDAGPDDLPAGLPAS